MGGPVLRLEINGAGELLEGRRPTALPEEALGAFVVRLDEPRVDLQGTAVRDVGLGVLTFLEIRSEEHTSELQSQSNLVCRLLLEKKKADLFLSHALSPHLMSHYTNPTLGLQLLPTLESHEPPQCLPLSQSTRRRFTFPSTHCAHW